MDLFVFILLLYMPEKAGGTFTLTPFRDLLSVICILVHGIFFMSFSLGSFARLLLIDELG